MVGLGPLYFQVLRPHNSVLTDRKMEAGGLVSSREDISTLSPEQTDAAKFKELSSQFCSLRTVRGDGNCFYRAFSFSHMESLLHNSRALQRFKDKIIQSGELLSSIGLEERRYKQHQDIVVNMVEHCRVDDHEGTLLQLFNDPAASDSMVQYLRLLTSAHLQRHSEFFSNFVEAPNLQAYCRQEVERMSMECDHVCILALSEALDVCIHIVSMDGDVQHLAHHVIPEGGEPSLHLLYQALHYNILYQRTPL